MVDFKKLFEASRKRVLRQAPINLFKKNFAFPRLSSNKSGKASEHSISEQARRPGLGRKGKKQKRAPRPDDVDAGERDHEVSLQGRELSQWEANKFRNLLSGEIRLRTVDWEELEKNEKLQAELYHHLGHGIVRVKNIPKIPQEYEPTDTLYLGIDTEDDSYGRPHFYQVATRDYVFFSASFRLLIRYVTQEFGLERANHVVWGTNIEYEFGNISKDFDQDLKTISIKWRRGKLSRFDLIYDPERLYWANQEDRKGYFRIWDTMNHWPKSVKEMGKTLSDYLKIDFSKLEPNFYGFQYAAMDAIISRSYACIQKKYYDQKKILLLTTPGATALKLYLGAGKKGDDKEKFCHHKIYKLHSDSELEWLEKGLRGGRTEVFSLREHYGKVSYLDINSAYPFAMKYPHYPNPVSFFEVEGHDRISQIMLTELEGMAECEVEAVNLHPFAMVYPYLGGKDEGTGRFVFPLGKWKARYTFFEIRKAQALGYKFRFTKAYCYERCQKHPFQRYVDFCYGIRIEGNRTGNKVLKDIGKSLGNNLYGKWGQKLIFTELVDPDEYNPDDLIHCTRFGNTVLLEKNGGYAPHTNMIWGAYITSICRDLLYQHMLKAWMSGNYILYCDTDSIFITGGELPENDPEKLGALKHEDDLYYFRARLPKCYEYIPLDRETGTGVIDPKTGKPIVVYKSKGVPQWLEQTDEHGKPILDEHGNPLKINLREKFAVDGIVSYRRPLKFREALRRKNIKDKDGKDDKRLGRGVDAVNGWVDIVKENVGDYNKRTVLPTKWTVPNWIGMKVPDWYSPPDNLMK